jgi:REP element-mobilizing transposase RayT
MPVPYDPDLLHRRSIRLRDYDYTQGGAYFLTVCVHDRACLLGEIVNGDIRLSAYGEIVDHEWQRTPSLRPQVSLDLYVIMPNHFHAILVITDAAPDSVGAYCNTPLQKPPLTPSHQPLQFPSQTVGAIVRGFKAAVTKQVNLLRRTPGLPFWQRNYWEHVIRDDADLARLRPYIEQNPGKWAEDKYHPSHTKL